MNAKKYFRAFLQAELSKESAFTQVKLAQIAKVQYKQFNGFLHGRQGLSETARERIAQALNFKYEETLCLGRKRLENQQSRKPFPAKEAEDFITVLLKLLSSTNWSLLQRQKLALLASLKDNGDSELLEGLINFLDAIQDWAVDTYGLPEEVVFDKGGCHEC